MPSGNILIKVSTAEQLIPVMDANVFVIKRQNGENDILASRTTGKSGFAPCVPVETPEKAGSMSPGEKEAFANIDIRVEHPRYYPYYVSGAQVFADTQSVQNVVLIPRAVPTEKRTENIIITPQNL